MRLVIRFCLAAILTTALLPGQELPLALNGNGEKVCEQGELPNPLSLKPNWYCYFNVPPKQLKERNEKLKGSLKKLVADVEDPEDKTLMERYQKEVESRLSSLLLLKKRKISEESLSWVPKEKYSIKEYLQTADKLWEVELDIEQYRAEEDRIEYVLYELNQNVGSLFLEYRELTKPSREKLLLGMEVMAQKIRALYLQDELDFIGRRIAHLNDLLSRYRDEWVHINEHIEITPQEKAGLEEEKRKVGLERRIAHRELLNLEEETIWTHVAEPEKREKGEFANQRFVGALIKNSLLRARFVFLEAKELLVNITERGLTEAGGRKLEEVGEFLIKAKEQLKVWDKTVSGEVEQANQMIVVENGESSDEKIDDADTEKLKTLLNNRLLIERLRKELAHIDLIKGLIDEEIVEKQTVGMQAVYYTGYFFSEIGNTFSEFFGFILFEMGGVPITLLGVMKAVVIVVLAFVISSLVQSGLKRISRQKVRLGEPTLYTLGRVLHYLILLIGLLIALSSLGLTTSNIAIILGALGVGIGFGLQNIVNNFMCGLTILFEGNFKVGDFVELESGQFGKIVEINVQSSTIHTFDGLDIVLPNSAIVNSKMINWTKHDPYQRLHIPFGVAYGTDQDLVSEAAVEAAHKVPSTLGGQQGKPEPEVWLVEFGESSLNFELIVWVNIFRSIGRSSLRAGYLAEIEKELKAKGITIPFPQRDLHIKSITSDKLKVAH